MSACDTCVVRNRAICSSLDGDELKALNAIGRRRVLAPGESLMWEGEDSVLVANVIDGVVLTFTDITVAKQLEARLRALSGASDEPTT